YKTPLDTVRRVFYKEWKFYNTHPKKTQIFYEYILIDTSSIKISPKTNPKNPNLITPTSIFIQKIITLKNWNQPPHSHRQFLGQYIPSIYNYFDYMDDWRHTFLYKNLKKRHSWFLCLDKTFNID
ncbi:hypothetical protein CFOL_v3_25764, partial [Cephalotus follicularis]